MHPPQICRGCILFWVARGVWTPSICKFAQAVGQKWRHRPGCAGCSVIGGGVRQSERNDPADGQCFATGAGRGRRCSSGRVVAGVRPRTQAVLGRGQVQSAVRVRCVGVSLPGRRFVHLQVLRRFFASVGRRRRLPKPNSHPVWGTFRLWWTKRHPAWVSCTEKVYKVGTSLILTTPVFVLNACSGQSPDFVEVLQVSPSSYRRFTSRYAASTLETGGLLLLGGGYWCRVSTCLGPGPPPGRWRMRAWCAADR